MSLKRITLDDDEELMNSPNIENLGKFSFSLIGSMNNIVQVRPLSRQDDKRESFRFVLPSVNYSPSSKQYFLQGVSDYLLKNGYYLKDVNYKPPIFTKRHKLKGKLYRIIDPDAPASTSQACEL